MPAVGGCMGEQIDLFLQDLAQRRNLSANTTAAYRTDLDQFRIFLEERSIHSWQDVSREDVLAFLLFLRERRYANATVARRTAAVKSFYAFLTATQQVTADPTDNIDSPKVDRYVPRSLTPTQVDELLELPLREPTPERLRDKAMLEMLYAAGLRVSELTALNVDDVRDGQIHCSGKGDRARLLPLNASALTALEEYFDIARPQLAQGNAPQTSALFLNHRGTRLTRQGFWLILKQYAESLDLPDLTPHTLRHSFAVHMLANGADVRAVQALLGHASLSTTQIYTQLNAPENDVENGAATEFAEENQQVSG